MSFFVGGEGARPAAANAREDDKVHGLNRMRRTATALLLLMCVLLLVCVVWQADHAWLAWPRAFAEAGMAGAIPSSAQSGSKETLATRSAPN